jgi:hypothetical protein
MQHRCMPLKYNPGLNTKKKKSGLDLVVTRQCISRHRLDKHPAIRSLNNRTNVYRLLLCNSQRANGQARWISRDLFSVWSPLRNNRTVFSVLGPCGEDMREYGNGNLLDLSSEVPKEQQCGQMKN